MRATALCKPPLYTYVLSALAPTTAAAPDHTPCTAQPSSVRRRPPPARRPGSHGQQLKELCSQAPSTFWTEHPHRSHTCLGLHDLPCDASHVLLPPPFRTKPSPHTAHVTKAEGLERRYPALFDGFVEQLHHIRSLHSAHFKSLCPGNEDTLRKTADGL